MLDAADPAKPTLANVIGQANCEDLGSGEVTRTAGFAPFAAPAPFRLVPAADTPHTFSVFMAGVSCPGEATATGAAIDVIGMK